MSIVTMQACQLEQLLVRAPASLRREVLELCVRYAEFAGWLHQDAGFMLPAQSWSDRAHDYAEELGNPQLRSYVLMRKSNLATDSGRAARAISLANAALRDLEQLTPRLRAVALRQQALASALSCDETTCAAALDAAVVDASQVPVNDPTDPFPYCTSSYVLMEAGSCWLQLHRPVKAVECLEAALDGWPETFRRDRGLAMARLARALLANRELDKSCAVALDAVGVARSTASSRTNKQLRLLAQGLAPYRQMPVVSEVQGELKRLT
jgi:tetratricopeptide (TPR) repeat protein